MQEVMFFSQHPPWGITRLFLNFVGCFVIGHDFYWRVLTGCFPPLQHVWSENEDCLPFLQRAQDYISACGRKSLVQVLDEVFSSFRPVSESRELVACPKLQLFYTTNNQFDLPVFTLKSFLVESFGLCDDSAYNDVILTPASQLLDLPDTDDTETFEQYHTNVEEEPETDHQQLAVSQQ